MELHEVIPGLFIRGHFEKNKDKISTLKEAGISTVVCLLDKVDWDLLTSGIALLRYPLTDGKHVNEVNVKYAVDSVVRARESNVKVLVHCQGGKNRAGLVVALAIMRLCKCTPEVALNVLRSARPGAVNNRVFEEYIIEKGNEYRC